jgi:DNA (cytosine-5)-methyltransferase 1
MSKFYFIDLFAGCGGLSLGLEQAGFTPVFVNELNQDAMATYKQNRLEEYPWLDENSINDIKDLVLKNNALANLKKKLKKQHGITDIDLITGGPPCQGFSGIGHRRSYSVDKKQLPSNHLYEDMAYVINTLKPKIFLFENVRGLLNARWTKKGKKHEIWEDVYYKFSSLKGYDVEYSLVHAKDYGVPQNRPRVLLVGIRKDIKVTKNESLVAKGFLPEPINGAPDIEQIFSDIVDDVYMTVDETKVYPEPARNKFQKYFRKEKNNIKVKRKGETLTEHQYSKHSDPVVKKFKYMIQHNGKIHESMKTKKFAQRLLPRKWDVKGPSITATSLPDDYVHYCQPRSLTVREWARLQMFPDWYQFSGKRTTGGIRRAGNPREGLHEREVPKYTQIGNAVPVKLAYEVGEHFKKILSKKTSKKKLSR